MSRTALLVFVVISVLYFRVSSAKVFLYRNFLIEANVARNRPLERSSEQISEDTAPDPEESGIQYDGAQVLKIHTRKLRRPEINILLNDYEGEIWSVNVDGIDMLIKKDYLWEAKAFLNDTDLTHNVLIDDVQRKIEDGKIKRMETSIARLKLQAQRGLTFNSYQDLSNIYNYFFKLIRDYPTLCSILSIGRTEEGRELKVLKVSNGRYKNRAIFVLGGAEGRDWISSASVTYFMHHIVTHWRNYTLNIRNFDWYFLPVANPDGYEYSRTTDRLWSKNRRKGRECDGVNIERNFGDNWGGPGSSGDPCSPFFRGPERFSEPETVAIQNLLLNLKKKLDAYISIGGYGQQILYPWGDSDVLPTDFRELHTVSSKAIYNIQKKTGKEYSTGPAFKLGLPSAGNSCDWVKGTLETKYVYNMMLQDLGKYGYLLPPSSITECGDEVTQMVLTVVKHILETSSVDN